MPQAIQQSCQDSTFICQWYEWGVFIALVATIGVLIWIFSKAERTGQEATQWKSIAMVAAVLTIPALLARLHPGFANDIRDSLMLVAYLSILAVVLTGFAAFGFTSGQRQILTPGPIVTTPIAPTTEPMSGDFASGTTEGDMLMGPNTRQYAAPVSRRKTESIKVKPQSQALAFLVVTAGPYINTTFPLKSDPGETTTLGRVGGENDHIVDDSAVSARHLSIRYRDSQFVVTDLDTENGTTVNGERVHQCVLHHDDEIEIGRTRLRFWQVRERNSAADGSGVEPAQHSDLATDRAVPPPGSARHT